MTFLTLLAVSLQVSSLPGSVAEREKQFDAIISEVATVGGQSVELSKIPATLTIDEIRAIQVRWRERLIRLRASFEVQQMLPDRTVDWQIEAAFSGPRRFASFLDKNANTGRSWVAFDGNRQTEYFESLATAKLGIDGMVSPVLDDRLKIVLTTANVTLDEKLKGTGWYVPTLLGRGEKLCRVLPDLQLVDGEECHVLRSPSSQIWFDHKRSCSVRRWVKLRRTSLTQPGTLSMVRSCSDFEELSSGLWWPTKTITVNYANAKLPASMRGQVSRTTKVIVKSLSVDFDEGIFSPVVPPGSRVHDLQKRVTYLMPEGKELLDEAIKLGAKISDDDTVYGDPQPVPSPPWLFVANLVGVLVILVFLIWHRSRGMSRAS